jgi:putative holliday junction resolvase
LKVLAVDPGDKRIGLAISDPTGTIARPLSVISHTSKEIDAEKIVMMAEKEQAEMIIVGWPLDSEGNVGYRARKSKNFAVTIESKTKLPVKMWDESGTTQAALQSRIAMGVSRKKRKGHLDDIAATILLQDYLDNYANN